MPQSLCVNQWTSYNFATILLFYELFTHAIARKKEQKRILPYFSNLEAGHQTPYPRAFFSSTEKQK